MSLVLKKYWWLIVLAIVVFIFRVFPDTLPFLEKIEPASSANSSDLPETVYKRSQGTLYGADNQQSSKELPAIKIANVSNFPHWVAEQLSELKDGLTLAQWKRNHPDETVFLFGTGGHADILINDDWCARAELSVVLPGGKTAVRHSVFYPPVAPSTFELPKEDEIAKDHIDNNCALGIIWINLLEYDEAQGKTLALQVRDIIDQRFGKGEADTPLKRVDAKYLSQTGRWQVGNAVIISAYDTFPTIAAISAGRITFEKKVFALGFLPLSDFSRDGERFYGDRYGINRADNVQRIREAVMTANISRQDGDALLSYFPANGGTPTLKPNEAESLITLLERWIAASEKLDSTRKAGALIVADQALDHMQGQIGTSSIEKGGRQRRRLEKLGAKFFNYELEQSYLYDHSWLEAARTIDSAGPMGDLAFRMLMEMGCSSYGKFGYQEVINQGEEYLKKDHNSMNRAEVELLVADAYRDMVALSLGKGEGFVIPEDFNEDALSARQKALMHYKNALPLLKASALTPGAWREAWRLTTGLPPAGLRYYCVYD